MANKHKAKSAGTAHQPPQPPPHTALRPANDASLLDRLFTPIDITPLVYFRIAFGLLMLWLGWKYFHGENVLTGKPYNLIKYFYVDPKFHLTYYGFDWVTPLSEHGMYDLCYLMGFAAAMMALGLLYRLAAAFFCLGFTYLFLLEQARYLHHYYLICLLSLLLIFIPANRKFSLDAMMRPKLRSNTAPAWSLWLLRLQLGVVYFYAGVAKCNGDWLRGAPMKALLANTQEKFSGLEFLTRYFTEDWFAQMMAWGGAAFDLAVFPLLLFRRTRWIALAGNVVFHVSNAYLFDIDIFPWLMLSSTVILFFPDWLPFRKTQNIHATLDGATDVDGANALARPVAPLGLGQRVTAWLVLAYCVIQVVVPLRPFFYSGNPNWTGNGRKFSWRMLSRDLDHKDQPRFLARFRMRGRDIQQTIPTANAEIWQRDWQHSTILKNPDLLLQYVHWLAANMRQQGAKNVEIRVELEQSLNGREFQNYVDPDRDLVNEPRRLLTPYPWVVPLENKSSAD